MIDAGRKLADSPHTAKLMIEHAETCAWAGLFELRVRHVADHTAETRSTAFKADVSPLFTRLAEHYPIIVTDDVRKRCELAFELRNKVLHCDFASARGALGRMGITLAAGRVQRMTPTDLLQRIQTGDSPSTNVSDDKTKVARLYGVMLDFAVSEGFAQSRKVFFELYEKLGQIFLDVLENDADEPAIPPQM